jgi:sugar-specific transcriptional regulator TrmB
MNTMINPSNEYNDDHRYSNRSAEEVAQLVERIAELETRIEVLDAEIAGQATVLRMADDSLQSYKADLNRLNKAVFEYADNREDFFDAIVEMFDIELTKMVTVQMTVSIEVQATVPYDMEDDEVAEELTNATLDYSFFGNGDIVIEDWSFGNLEVE